MLVVFSIMLFYVFYVYVCLNVSCKKNNFFLTHLILFTRYIINSMGGMRIICAMNVKKELEWIK